MRQIHEAIRDTMTEPGVRKSVADSGSEMFVTSPQEFARFIAEETKMWAGVRKGLAVQQQ